MICPYCSNEIKNDVTKCPICGVDLEYQIENKNKNTVGGIACIIFGGVFLFIGLVSMITMRASSNVMSSSSESISKSMSIVGCMPIFIGLLILGIGVYNVISNRHLKDNAGSENKKSNNVVSVMFMTIFFIMWFTILSYVMVGFKSSGAFNKPFMIIFFTPFTIVPFIIMIKVIITIVKGKGK